MKHGFAILIALLVGTEITQSFKLITCLIGCPSQARFQLAPLQLHHGIGVEQATVVLTLFLSIGFFLDNVFFGSRYWINDPWTYRLPEVYGPYRWVRYYDDVVLVNIYTGEVVDVIHDFFW